MTTLTEEALQAIIDGTVGVTPGPWETDTTRSDGSYGNGDDTHEGFDAYQLIGPPTYPGGKDVVICDTLNSDTGYIEEDWDEESHSAWDEQGRKNMAHIARLDPQTVTAICELALIGLRSTPLSEPVAFQQREMRFDGRTWSDWYPTSREAWDEWQAGGRGSLRIFEVRALYTAPPEPLIGVVTEAEDWQGMVARIVATTHQPNPTDAARFDVAPGKHREFQEAIKVAKTALLEVAFSALQPTPEQR